MAAFDKLRQRMGGGPGPVEGAMLAAALTQSEGKARALAKAVKDIAIWRLTPMVVTLGGAFLAVRGTVRAIVRDSGALEAAWQRMARLKLYQNQLAPLVGGIAQARQKLGELVVFANRFKLPLGEVVAAQRALIVMGQGALSSGRALETAKNIARTTGVGIAAAAQAYANLHRALAGGAPVAEAAQEMRGLGAMTAQTAREIGNLQESGAGTTAVLAALAAGLAATTTTTTDMSAGIGELEAKLDKTRETMAAAFGEPFLEAEAKSIERSIATAENLVPVMKTLGQTLAAVTTTGSGLTGWIKEQASAVPGLAAGVGFLAKSFVVVGTAVSAAGLVAGARTLWMLGAAALAAARSMSTATLATRLHSMAATARLAAIRATTQGDLLAARAHHLYAATLLRGAAATTLVGNASAAAGSKVRGFFAAFISNPIGLAIAAVVAVVAGIWQVNEAMKAQRQAVKDLADANAEVAAKLGQQVKDIKSVDDAQQALIDSTNALAEARLKLAAIDAVLKGKATKEQKALAGENVSENLRTEQVRNVRGLAARKGEASGKLGYERGHLAPSKNMDEVARDRARQALALDQQQKDFVLNRATGADKVGKLRAEAGRKGGLAGEAAQYALETAHWKDAEKEAMGSKGKLASIAALRRNSKSTLIRDEQALADLRANKKADPKAIAAAQTALTLKREYVQANGDPREAARLNEEADSAEKMERLRKIGLEGAQKEADLRREGLQRTEDEARIKIETLTAEASAAADRRDQPAYEEAAVRIDAARQELAYAQKRAKIEREADASRLAILALERESATKALRGDFAGSAAARQQAIAAEDAAKNKARDEALKTTVADPAARRKIIGDEQRDREAGRAFTAEQFRATEVRSVTARELARGRKRGDAEEATRMQMEDSVRADLARAQEANLSPEEAADFARRKGVMDLHDQMKQARSEAPAVVSSLARIGGGGNVLPGLDVLKEEAKRHTVLLDVIAKNTGAGAPRLK